MKVFNNIGQDKSYDGSSWLCLSGLPFGGRKQHIIQNEPVARRVGM